MLLLNTSGHDGVGVGLEKSLSNLRTPKQRNCKILNYKAKETHLIPQELQYVFQLGYPIPRKDTAMHQNLERYNIRPAHMWAQSQPAPALLAPVGLITLFLSTTERGRRLGGSGKICLIHFAYQRIDIYTFKIIVTYAFSKFSMLKDEHISSKITFIFELLIPYNWKGK